jgi:hypothetical protein
MKVMRKSSAHDAETDDPDNAFPLRCHCRFQLLSLTLWAAKPVDNTNKTGLSRTVVFPSSLGGKPTGRHNERIGGTAPEPCIRATGVGAPPA